MAPRHDVLGMTNAHRTIARALTVLGTLAVLLTIMSMHTGTAMATTPTHPCGGDAECAALDTELVPWDVSGPALGEFAAALIDAGYHGDPEDGTDDVIYAPMWEVVDVPRGTWTTTPWGAARCVDWETTGQECTQGAFLPGWPDFEYQTWMPDDVSEAWTGVVLTSV